MATLNPSTPRSGPSDSSAPLGKSIKDKVTIPKSLAKQVAVHKAARIGVGIISLGASELIRLGRKQVYHLAILPTAKDTVKERDEAKASKEKVHEDNPETTELLEIKTKDNVKLEAMVYRNPDAIGDPPKWIIKFCGNGENFGNTRSLDEEMLFAESVGANLLVFNYRGVGQSEGSLSSLTELSLDGSAVVEHLRKQGVKEEDILLFGHSLGGAVATVTAKHYPGIKVFNDRSLSSTASFGKILPGKFLAKIAPPLIKAFGANLDAKKAWNKIEEENKGIAYHPEDGVIPYHEASLYKALKDDIRKEYAKEHPGEEGKGKLPEERKPQAIKYRQGVFVDQDGGVEMRERVKGEKKEAHPLNHNFPKHFDQDTYEQIVIRCQEMLGIEQEETESSRDSLINRQSISNRETTYNRDSTHSEDSTRSEMDTENL